MNLGLYSPSAPQTLLSLGHIHGCGGSFCTTTTPNALTIFADPSTALATTDLIQHANLYPANLFALRHSISSNPHLSVCPTQPPSPTLLPVSLRHFVSTHPPLPPLCAFGGTLVDRNDDAALLVDQSPSHVSTITTIPTEEDIPPSTTPLLRPHHQRLPTFRRITASQYARVLDAVSLHNTQAHIPDQQLCEELSHGKHPYSSLTSTDIMLMRHLLGPCPQCQEGRAFKPAATRHTSHTLPAERPGQTISFDPQKLPNTVLGKFTHKVTMVDENTGHISQPGIPSKSTASMFNGIHNVIRKTFNASGHKVHTLHGDAERVNTSLAPHFGSIGARLKVSLPGHHAHRAERTNQTIDDRARSVVATLPYTLPPELTLLLHQSVGETLNNSICTASAPLTPNEALSGFKPARAPIAFGRCAMVLQPDDKRRSLSTTSGTPLTLIPVTELGVSMGLQAGTDRTQWLLANGVVVPRLPIGPLLPPHFTPFNWKSKPVIPLQLPFSQVNQPVETRLRPHTTNTIAGNHPVQFPDMLNSTAVQLIQPPAEPLSADPLLITSNTLPTSISSLPPTNKPHDELSPPPILPTPFQYPASPPLPPPTTPARTLPLPTHSTAAAIADQQILADPQSPPPTTYESTSPPRSSVVAPPPRSSQFIPPVLVPLPTRMVTRSRSSSIVTPSAPRGAYGGWGHALLSSTQDISGHQLRKRHLLHQAALRDRQHIIAHPPPPELNNRSTDIRPTPPRRQQNEFPLHKALLVLDPPKVHAAVDKEIKKIFSTYTSLKIIKPNDVETTAVFVPTKLIIREKTNKDVTARMALGGDRQPPHTYGETHAGTSDATHRAFVLAAGLAHAAHIGLPLLTFSFDIPAAFINKNALTRTHTGNTQLYTRTPHNLPPPHDGVLCEVTGAHYGLKQSNHIYDQDFIQLMTNDGFTQAPSHPYTFTKWSIPGKNQPPSHHIHVSMHVDDGDGNTTSPEMYADFQKLITTRYGDLPFHCPSTGTCGQLQERHPDNSIKLHCGPYILKMLTRIGMDAVPPALSPDVRGLFDLSTDTTKLSTAARAEFRTTNGELIHILPPRHDIKRVVTHLLTKGESPDNSDYLKQLHLLRYLKATPNLGPTFSANPANYPNGVEISSSSDCAHNVHTDGQSHSAYTLTVGKAGATTAPFLSYSAAEKGVSLSPMEGEYVTLSKTAKQLIHYRQFATDLGYPQLQPSIMLTDNASSLHLTSSPLIPAKSRHIALKHHHIRWAFKTKQIKPQHQGSADIVPDALTKHVGPSRFLFFRQQVFQHPCHAQFNTTLSPPHSQRRRPTP